MDGEIAINEKINPLQDLIKLISEALNLSFFFNFASIIQISVTLNKLSTYLTNQ